MCSARSASSVYSSPISTLTLISEVEIAWMLMPLSASVANIWCAMPAWLRMPTPMTEILHHLGVGDDALEADLVVGALQHRQRPRQIGPADREGEVGVLAVAADRLDDHVDVDAVARQRAEDGRGDARPVADAQHGDPRLVAAVGDPADDLAFHDLVLVHDQRAGPVLEARQHLDPHTVLHRQRHRAGLQHLGAQRGHLQHLLVGDAVELARLGDDPRVGGVDAVDVGEDVAALGAQRRRQRHGRGVRAAAAERGHAALGPMPWKPATTATWPASRQARTGAGSISRIRALPWRRRSGSPPASPGTSAPARRSSAARSPAARS